jgi:hypothetical protein
MRCATVASLPMIGHGTRLGDRRAARGISGSGSLPEPSGAAQRQGHHAGERPQLHRPAARWRRRSVRRSRDWNSRSVRVNHEQGGVAGPAALLLRLRSGRAAVIGDICSPRRRRRHANVRVNFRHSDTARTKTYGVDVPAMQLERRGWDIHALSAGRERTGAMDHRPQKCLRERRRTRGRGSRYASPAQALTAGIHGMAPGTAGAHVTEVRFLPTQRLGGRAGDGASGGPRGEMEGGGVG